MGLDTSHDCWHGAYSAFMRWRVELAKAAGLPPLLLMEGFYVRGNPIADPFWRPITDKPLSVSEAAILEQLPIRWESLRPDPLYILLHHSDCDGEISAEDCVPIADSMERLLPSLNGDGGGHIGFYRDKTQQFINGLRLAASRGEAVQFR